MEIYNFLLAQILCNGATLCRVWLIRPFGPICCGSFANVKEILAQFLRFAICTNYTDVLTYIVFIVLQYGDPIVVSKLRFLLLEIQ